MSLDYRDRYAAAAAGTAVVAAIALATAAVMVTVGGLAGCSNHDVPGHVHVAAPPFQPTAFSVEVHGHGRPVILIPGLGGDGAVWAGTVAHLAGYQTHVLTLAGFAGTPALAEGTPLAAATRDQLARYIVDRKLDHPIVIGHSLGGFIAYWLAASAPDLVGPVVVVDAGPSLGTGDPQADAQTGDKLRAMWANASDDAFAQQAHDAFGAMVSDAQQLAPILDAVQRSDRKVIGDAVREMFTTDLRSGLAQIRAPLLLVLADGSLQDGLEAAVAKVPDHEVVVIPHAKHFVFVDAPVAFDAALDQFIAKHPAARPARPATATALLSAATPS
jgi:pimeloyl-ACP methyl ester carboxylesterase